MHGGIFYVTGLVAENGPEELFFRCRIAFPFRSNLPDKDVPLFDLRTYADYAVFIEVFQGVFTDIVNIPCKLFLATFCIPDIGLEFMNMYRSEDIVVHEPLTQHDRILEVIPSPWHERNKNVFTECKLSLLGR